METDKNQNPSASCFPQLEPTRKEGRRSMKSAGREDTTRREESAENCRVQFAVSERMRDMHRKVHMWKEVGELSSTKREPSVVLRSNSARDGKVTQQSLTKTRQPHAYFRFFANIAPVQLNILKIHATTSPLEHPRYDEHGILPLVNSISENSQVQIYNPKPTSCGLPVLHVLYKRNPHPQHTSATKLQDTAILFPDHQNILEKTAGSTEQ